jgi:hypothetical protein
LRVSGQTAPGDQLQVIGHLLPRAIGGAALSLSEAALKAASDGFDMARRDPNGIEQAVESKLGI